MSGEWYISVVQRRCTPRENSRAAHCYLDRLGLRGTVRSTQVGQALTNNTVTDG